MIIYNCLDCCTLREQSSLTTMLLNFKSCKQSGILQNILCDMKLVIGKG